MKLPISRRSLFGAVAAIAAPPGAAVAASTADWDVFAQGLALAEPSGAEAVAQARAAGMKLGDLNCIIMRNSDPKPGRWPVLMFRLPDGTFRSFRPCGEDL